MSSFSFGSTVYFLAHSHLDTAWLWRTDDTRRAFLDTVRRMVKLAHKYPWFIYAQSSALYYSWLAEDDRELFEEVRRLVREGRWEVVGGSWIECDCVMVSGEGLVRQFLKGKRWLRKHGLDTDVAWFPDSFGFPASLPKILRGCGIKYLVIQKLNWNDTVLFPYNLWWWEADDGSRILVYQTLGGYWGDPREIEKIRHYIAWLWIRQGITDLLVLYGLGDHGGGPTEDMVAATERVVHDLRALGVVRCGHCRARDYMQLVEMKYGSSLPIYVGELYLQFHRGVYTSQAKLKNLIKSGERLAMVYEKLGVLAEKVMGVEVPWDLVDSWWEDILVGHFHDVMSGTLGVVAYAELRYRFEELVERQWEELRSLLQGVTGVGGGEDVVVFFNPLPRSKRVCLELVGGRMVCEELPPLSIVSKRLSSTSRRFGAVSVREESDNFVLENRYLRVVIDRGSGFIKSIYRKDLGIEFLSPPGIHIEIFDDKPMLGRMTMGTFEKFADYFFDCWEIYAFQRIDGIKSWKPRFEKVWIEELGPDRVSVACETTFVDEGGESIIKHIIRLYPDEPWIEGVLEVDWNAVHKLMKLVIPLSFWAEHIVAGQPFGYVVRRNPLSVNATLFDRAAWEANFNEWVDYSDGSKGLAFICGDRFGYDVLGNLLRPSILRAPRFPPDDFSKIEDFGVQPVVEQEHHEVRYYVYPHLGDWVRGRVPTVADTLLTPSPTFITRGREMRVELLRVEPSDVLVPTIKPCCEDDCIVVRLFNPYPEDKVVKLEIVPENLRIRRATEANHIEDDLAELQTSSRSLEVRLGKHEVKTVKLWLERMR